MTLPAAVPICRWTSFFDVPIDDRRRLGQLSRGTRQLVGLRVLLAGEDADLVLLDEPWEGLDPEWSAWLTQEVRRWRAGGAAVLISSHRLHDLDTVCTRYLLLEGGRCHRVTDRELRPRVDQLMHAVTGRGRA
jgi:ABC-type multidrug transport system ATPase subunit